MCINRCRDSDDVGVASCKILHLIAEGQMGGRGQIVRTHLLCGVVACAQLRDARSIDVKAKGRTFGTEGDRQWQPDISQPDHRDFQRVWCVQYHRFLACYFP